MCICVYVCMCVCVCVTLCMYMYVYVCVCVNIFCCDFFPFYSRHFTPFITNLACLFFFFLLLLLLLLFVSTFQLTFSISQSNRYYSGRQNETCHAGAISEHPVGG